MAYFRGRFNYFLKFILHILAFITFVLKCFLIAEKQFLWHRESAPVRYWQEAFLPTALDPTPVFPLSRRTPHMELWLLKNKETIPELGANRTKLLIKHAKWNYFIITPDNRTMGSIKSKRISKTVSQRVCCLIYPGVWSPRPWIPFPSILDTCKDYPGDSPSTAYVRGRLVHVWNPNDKGTYGDWQSAM